MPGLKKILKIILKIFVFLLILSFILTAALQIPYVQTQVVKLATNVLSKKLGTNVSIDYVNIKYFSKIELQKVIIEDQKQDTLLYAERLYLNLPYYIYNFKVFKVEEIELENADLNIIKYKNELVYNYQTILDQFKGDPKDTSAASAVFLDEIKAENLHVHFTDENDTISAPIHITEIFFEIEDLEITEPKIAVNIDYLRLKSNYNNISQLSASLLLTKDSILLEKLIANTSFSKLDIPLIHISKDPKYIIPNIIADINKSSISYNDIKPWLSNKTASLFGPVHLEGNFSSFRNKIQFNNSFITYGLMTEVNLNGWIQLIQKDSASFKDANGKVKIIKCQTNKNELENLVGFINNVLTDTAHTKIEIPQQIKNLNHINFVGNLEKKKAKGSFKGVLTTDQGELLVQSNLQGILTDTMSVQGSISSKKLDVGKILDVESLLANIKLNATFSSKITHSNMLTHVKATIDSAQIYNYTYQQMQIEGNLSNNNFVGEVNLNDAHADILYKGEISWLNMRPKLKGEVDISKLDIESVGLLKTYPGLELTTKGTFDFEQNKHQQWEGTVQLLKTNMVDARKNPIEMKELNFSNKYIDSLNREIILTCDPFSFWLHGQLNEATLSHDFVEIIESSFKNEPSLNHNRQNFEFKLQTNNTKEVTAFFFPDIQILKPTTMRGELIYADANSYLNIYGDIPSFSYQNLDFKNTTILINEKNRDLNSKLFVATIEKDKKNINNNFSLETISGNKLMNFVLKSSSDTSLGLKVDIDGIISFDSSRCYKISLSPSSIVSVKDTLWRLEAGLSCRLDSFQITIPYLKLSHNNQYLIASLVYKDFIQINSTLKDFDLTFINPYLYSQNIKLNGFVNGPFNMYLKGKDFKPQTDLIINELEVNDFLLGKTNLKCHWDEERASVYLDAFAKNETDHNNIDVKGYYSLKNKSSLDFDIKIAPINFQLLDAFAEGICSQFKGDGSLQIKLTGEPAEPILKGELNIDTMQFLVNFLNTHYYIYDQKIQIDPELISFNNLKVYDENKVEAKANGTVIHKNFKNLNYDISIRTQKPFFCLNTTERDNSSFYGKAYAKNSLIGISGHGNKTKIEVTGESGKGTEINIPLSNPTEIAQGDFIVFKKPMKADEKKAPIHPIKKENNLDLDLNLTVNSDAKLQIIFDEKLGDIIKTVGNGEIKMLINSSGKFQMFGNYIIEKGDYLFTFENLLNKKFQISNGSSITWNGDPYKAYVDINAIYKLRTSLAEFSGTDSTNTANKKRVPVDCRIHLSDELLKPTVEFIVELPTISDNDPIKSEFNSLMNSPDEIRRQFFSLLVLGKFLPAENNTYARGGVTSAGAKSSSELLSNQLSNWFSKISKEVDVGVNYRPGDKTSAEELHVGLSTQLFNNRLGIEGNVGAVGNNPNTLNETQQTNTSIAGDVFVEYKLSKTGKTSLKAYNKANDNSIIDASNSRYTQGVGIIVKKDFDSLSELVRSIFSFAKKKEKNKK